jgi:hypothetical protein
METSGIAAGPNRDAIASALQDFLRAEFGGEVRREEQVAEDVPTREGTALAVIAIVLALPGAINQLVTLAERAKLKQRLDALLERIRGAAGPDDTAVLRVGEARQLDLKAATSGEVLEALERARSPEG